MANTGKTAARNLRFEFDSAEIEKDQITASILSFMITRRTLAPGASIRLIWRTHFSKAGFETEEKDPEGMPEAGVLRAVYDGPDEQYCEESDILITESGLWPRPSAGEDNPGMENQDMKRL